MKYTHGYIVLRILLHAFPIAINLRYLRVLLLGEPIKDSTYIHTTYEYVRLTVTYVNLTSQCTS